MWNLHLQGSKFKKRNHEARIHYHHFNSKTNSLNLIPFHIFLYLFYSMQYILNVFRYTFELYLWQAFIWAFDQLPELHSLFRSSLEVAETQKCDGCGTHFQHRQFLTYRHVMHLKKFLKAYWLHIWNKKCKYLLEKYAFDHFREKIVLFWCEKKFWR